MAKERKPQVVLKELPLLVETPTQKREVGIISCFCGIY